MQLAHSCFHPANQFSASKTMATLCSIYQIHVTLMNAQFVTTVLIATCFDHYFAFASPDTHKWFVK